jgi:hypothetical protein
MEKLNQELKTREEYLKSALEEVSTENLICIAKQEINRLPELDPQLIGMASDLLMILDIVEKREDAKRMLDEK